MTDIGKKLAELFDIICVVMTTRPKLKNYTLRTLDSLGLLTSENIVSGKVHIQYDMPNVARKIVKNAIPKLNVYTKKDNIFWYTLNHYYTLAAAYHSGAEHALIFEDDAIILKDSDEVMRYLENIPPEYDFINFGNLPVISPNETQNFKNMLQSFNETEFYIKLNNGRNAQSLAMSRKFMEKMLRKIEARMTGEEDAELLVNDQWFKCTLFRDCNMWFSRKPLFIQQWDQLSNNNISGYNKFFNLYPNCNKEDYLYIEL